MQGKYLLTVAEASKVFGIGRDRLYELVRSQPDLPVLKIGQITKINAPMFELWLNEKTKLGENL